MRGFFLFVLLIAAAVTVTRQPPEILYDAPHPVAARFGTSAHPSKSLKNGDVVWQCKVTGPARETREQAHLAALEKASAQLEEALGLHLSLPLEKVESLKVEESETDVDLGPTMPAAKAMTISLALTNEKARQLATEERSIRSGKRLSLMWGVFSMVVVGLFVVAGSCRLADWTKSRRQRATG